MNGIDKKMAKLTSTAPQLSRNITQKTGEAQIINLVLGSPKGGEGNLDGAFNQRLVQFRWTSRTWVTNPLPYYWYANRGNDATNDGFIRPKKAKALRWEKNGKIFFSKKSPAMYHVGPDHRFFREIAIEQTRPQHMAIANTLVKEWMGK